MAWFTGTATNYLDLMDKVKGHVTNGSLGAQAWTVKRDQVNGDATREIIFMAPGSTGTEEIYIGIKSFFNVVGDYYNWILDGFIGYNDTLLFDAQPGSIMGMAVSSFDRPFRPQLPMWNQAMPYWLAVNGRRAVLITKVSNRYEVCYLGLLSPYGSAGQFSYPLVIGGSMTGRVGTRSSDTIGPVLNYKYTSDSVDHRHFVDAATLSALGAKSSGFNAQYYYHQTSLRFRKPDGAWLNCCNSSAESTTGGTSAIFGQDAISTFFPTTSVYSFGSTWPYNSNWYHGYTGTSVSSPAATRNISPLSYLTQCTDGSYPLFPIILTENSPLSAMYGEFDGLYWLPGTANSPESTVTIGDDSYFVVCNVFRLGAGDFWCVKMS